LTDSEKPYIPTFEQAKPKVEAAWKVMEARKLARKEAEAIAAAVASRGDGITPDFSLSGEGLRRGYEFTFAPSRFVARLVERPRSPLVRSEDIVQYDPYPLTEFSKIDYPRQDMVEEL